MFPALTSLGYQLVLLDVLYITFIVYQQRGGQWFISRMLDLRSSGPWFKPHWKHCVVLMSKLLYPLPSTGSIQESILTLLKNC